MSCVVMIGCIDVTPVGFDVASLDVKKPEGPNPGAPSPPICCEVVGAPWVLKEWPSVTQRSGGMGLQAQRQWLLCSWLARLELLSSPSFPLVPSS